MSAAPDARVDELPGSRGDASVAADASGRRHRFGAVARVGGIWRWEWRKLTAQAKVQAALILCVVAPILFVAVLNVQSSTPNDTLFGRWVHASGFATPLVVLNFAGQWAFPALACIVAGDIFSAEDRYGTWKTVLTRSRSRSDIFAGKVLAALSYAVCAVVLLAVASLLAGALFVGRQPLVGLSGQLVAPGHAVGLVLASWAVAVLPTIGFAAIGILLSVATRSSVIGVGGPVVLGLVMQLASLASGVPGLRTALLASPYTSWHGLWTTDQFFGPLWRGLLVSAVYVVVCLGVAYQILRRRDVRGS